MRWLYRLRVWLLRVVQPGEEQRALDEEIRFHLEMDARKLMERGLSRADARELAHIRFGDVDRVRQSARDLRWTRTVEESMHDLRLAVRGLIRVPGFTLLALLTLGLGIGATTVSFTLVDGVLLQPLGYRDPDRLVLIEEVRDDGVLIAPSHPNFVDWREQARPFSGMASAMFPYGQSVHTATEAVRVQSIGLSDGFFRILGLQPFLGREFTPEESRIGSPITVMVSWEFWHNHLGEERDLTGIMLRAFGGPVQVVGVVPPGFDLLGTADLFYPHELQPGTIRSAHNYRVIARLSESTTLAAAQVEMTALSRRLRQQFGDETQAVDARIVPLRDSVVGNQARTLLLLLAAGSLVLVISCVNIASSLLARGAGRRQELKIRTVLGAGRTRLVRQLGVESFVLASGGALLGVGFAFAALRAVRALGAGMLPRLQEVSVDGRALAFALALTMLTTLFVGLLPALGLTRAGFESLRERGSSTVFGGRSLIWKLLVGFELALAVLLLVGSGLLLRTLHNILSLDPGFEPRNVLTVSVSPESFDGARFEQLERELAALPGVLSAGMANRLPLAWGSWMGPVLRPEDVVPNWPAYAGFRQASPAYFETMRMPVLRGRPFSTDDRQGADPVAIVSQPLAELLWPGQDPIGKTVRTNYLHTLWLTVVGVVPEARNWSRPEGSQHEIYTAIAQHPQAVNSGLYFVLRTRSQPADLAPLVRQRLRDSAPDLPVVIDTMEDRLAETARDRRFAMFVLVAFAAVALILATVGIYSVVSYTTAVRTREIGVRLAIGATPVAVQREIIVHAALVTLAGTGAGVLAGLVATRALQNLLFQVEPLDPLTFTTGALILTFVAIVAAWVPARRFSRTDPLIALRAD